MNYVERNFYSTWAFSSCHFDIGIIISTFQIEKLGHRKESHLCKDAQPVRARVSAQGNVSAEKFDLHQAHASLRRWGGGFRDTVGRQPQGGAAGSSAALELPESGFPVQFYDMELARKPFFYFCLEKVKTSGSSVPSPAKKKKKI